MSSKILLAGCGDLGIPLGQRLHAEGHKVWGLRRSVSLLPDEIQPWQADLSDPASLQSAPAEFDLVVYTATPGAYEEAAYQRTYVEGVRNLLAVLEQQEKPPRRVVLSSSTSVFHHKDGEWVDEDTTVEPTHFSGRANLAGEQFVAASPVPSVSVRFGGIYGPGRTRLLKRVANGEAQCVEGQELFSNRVHRDDCVAILHHLLFLDTPDELYVGVDLEPATMCAVYNTIAQLLSVAPPPVVSPEEATRIPRSSKRIRNQRLLDTGYEFLYPTHREGYTALVKEWLETQ